MILHQQHRFSDVLADGGHHVVPWCHSSRPTQWKIGCVSVNLRLCLKIITDYGYSVITSNAKWDLTTSDPSCLYWKTGWITIRMEGDPLLWWGRIHFVRWFGFKSAGTNLWHEVILCWSFSPKFIHQLFTVNADCISVGNYKNWVFSLRQKECDTAEPTPSLMCRSRSPSSVRERGIIYVLETVCSGVGKKKKSRHIILNLS